MCRGREVAVYVDGQPIVIAVHVQVVGVGQDEQARPYQLGVDRGREMERQPVAHIGGAIPIRRRRAVDDGDAGRREAPRGASVRRERALGRTQARADGGVVGHAGHEPGRRTEDQRVGARPGIASGEGATRAVTQREGGGDGGAIDILVEAHRDGGAVVGVGRGVAGCHAGHGRAYRTKRRAV